LFVILFLSIFTFIISCTSVETQPITTENTGQIVIKVTFPEQQTKVIPPETTYFEVALQKEGSTSWTVQPFSKEGGTEQTATFTVTPGTYRIDACAKTQTGLLYGPDRFLAMGTTSVTVNAGETKQTTVTLCPIYYDFTETTTQATSTELVVLSYKMKVPAPFAEDFKGSGIWLKGTLEDAIGHYVSFNLSTVGIETIEVPLAGSVEYTIMQYTSQEFQAPSVTATTTYTWYSDQYVKPSKWIKYCHVFPDQTFTVIPGSGIIIGVQ
jgi:hypothetical protein